MNNINEIEKIIALFDSSENITELQVQDELGNSVKLSKLSNTPQIVQSTPQMGMIPTMLPNMINQSSSSIDSSTISKNSNEPASEKTITSPMVGVFYTAASPEATPYIQEGTVVKKGDIICIIEAMKIMNYIKAESNYQVKKILIENSQPVEFGQPLFEIE